MNRVQYLFPLVVAAAMVVGCSGGTTTIPPAPVTATPKPNPSPAVTESAAPNASVRRPAAVLGTTGVVEYIQSGSSGTIAWSVTNTLCGCDAANTSFTWYIQDNGAINSS